MRKDDPGLGRNEIVPSFINMITRKRHYMLDTEYGWLQACNGKQQSKNDIQWVEARHISCGRCRMKYLNL